MTRFDPEKARAAAALSAYPDRQQRETLSLVPKPAGRYYQHQTRNTPEPDMGWTHHAACQGQMDRMFPHGGPGWARRVADAVALCHTCPVAVDCRDYADWYQPADGVWAGVIWERGRPRSERVRVRPATPMIHGTVGGFMKHVRFPGEFGPACDDCRQAHNANDAKVRQARRVRQRKQRTIGGEGGVA